MKTGYEGYTVEHLFRCYQFENDRIDQRDAHRTKRLIRDEMQRRIKTAFAILDNMNGDDERVTRFYESFIQGRM